MHRVIYADSPDIDKYKESDDRLESDVTVLIPRNEILRVFREFSSKDKVDDGYLISGGLVKKVNVEGINLLIHISSSIMGSLDFEIRYDLHKYRYAKDINNPLLKLNNG